MEGVKWVLARALSKVVDGNEVGVLLVEAERGVLENLVEAMKRRYGDNWRKLASKLADYLEVEDPMLAGRLRKILNHSKTRRR